MCPSRLVATKVTQCDEKRRDRLDDFQARAGADRDEGSADRRCEGSAGPLGRPPEPQKRSWLKVMEWGRGSAAHFRSPSKVV
jgi:hypothetical protein